MPASNKQTTLWVADTLSWLLHFTRKFNLAIQSRFPDFRIIASSPLLIQRSYNGINERSLLCYSDRIAQDSHLIPSSDCYADYSQHFICSIWNYTDIIIARCQYAVNNPHNILSNFYHFIYIPHFFPTRSNFICFMNASAFLLRDARHAMHDILLLRISAILPEAISDGGLTPTTDTDLLLATYRGGSHLTSDINSSLAFSQHLTYTEYSLIKQ